jgi:hypothetical protein
MAKPFKELVEKHFEKRRQKIAKVLRWVELEEKTIDSHFFLHPDEILERVALEEELFGGIK